MRASEIIRANGKAKIMQVGKNEEGIARYPISTRIIIPRYSYSCFASHFINWWWWWWWGRGVISRDKTLLWGLSRGHDRIMIRFVSNMNHKRLFPRAQFPVIRSSVSDWSRRTRENTSRTQRLFLRGERTWAIFSSDVNHFDSHIKWNEKVLNSSVRVVWNRQFNFKNSDILILLAS